MAVCSETLVLADAVRGQAGVDRRGEITLAGERTWAFAAGEVERPEPDGGRTS